MSLNGLMNLPFHSPELGCSSPRISGSAGGAEPLPRLGLAGETDAFEVEPLSHTPWPVTPHHIPTPLPVTQAVLLHVARLLIRLVSVVRCVVGRCACAAAPDGDWRVACTDEN